MDQTKPSTSLSDIIAKRARERRQNRLKRLEEIEDWLIHNPFTHPEFQSYVEERNNISVVV